LEIQFNRQDCGIGEEDSVIYLLKYEPGRGNRSEK